jgi:ribosomal-protein-alanine acetyltransferase
VSTHVVLRPARVTDAAVLAAIEANVFPDAWSVDAFRESLRSPQTRVTVADDGGDIIGYAVLFVAADEAELANIAVIAEARGRGIGRRLLEAALDNASAAGAGAIYLEVRASNTPAQRLYEQAGFVRIGERRGYYRDPDEDAWVMRRSLAAAPGTP